MTPDTINTSELLMKLVEGVARIEQSVTDITRRLDDVANSTNAQLAALAERQGQTDVTLGKHEGRIASLERRADKAAQEREAQEQRLDDLKLRLYVLIAMLSAGGGLAGGLLGKALGL